MVLTISSFAGALLLSAAPALAQDSAVHQAHDKLMKGSALAIEGCVTAGENKDTFVLGQVKEIPGRPVQTGLIRVYRFKSVSKFRGTAGQVVRVDGRIDGIEDGQIEVKPGEAADGGMLVEFEVPGRDVDTTPGVVNAGTRGAVAGAPKTKVKTTVIKIDVDKVTPLRACGK